MFVHIRNEGSEEENCTLELGTRVQYILSLLKLAVSILLRETILQKRRVFESFDDLSSTGQ